MASLTTHLRSPESHERLPFHPDCPICRQTRLTGTLNADGSSRSGLRPRSPRAARHLGGRAGDRRARGRAGPGAEGHGAGHADRRAGARGQPGLRSGRRLDEPAGHRAHQRHRRPPAATTTPRPSSQTRDQPDEPLVDPGDGSDATAEPAPACGQGSASAHLSRASASTGPASPATTVAPPVPTPTAAPEPTTPAPTRAGSAQPEPQPRQSDSVNDQTLPGHRDAPRPNHRRRVLGRVSAPDAVPAASRVAPTPAVGRANPRSQATGATPSGRASRCGRSPPMCSVQMPRRRRSRARCTASGRSTATASAPAIPTC